MIWIALAFAAGIVVGVIMTITVANSGTGPKF